jgi:tetratricopeptide (TPR) repeat protein
MFAGYFADGHALAQAFRLTDLKFITQTPLDTARRFRHRSGSEEVMRNRFAAAAAVAAWLTGASAAAQQPAGPPTGPTHKHYEPSEQGARPGPNGELAPRLQDLGSHTFAVSTTNADAQKFVSQGLNLAYAFNHGEARRAFREAARLDPSLAMAYWGQALVLGPNINAMMEPNDEPHADELVKKALSLRSTATPRERALIEALDHRYSGTADRRTADNQAYADAMRAVHGQFPDDPDIAMLYVESMMDLRPWGYWMRDGRPHAGTAAIVALTEDVIRKHPKHPGALHMYIHLMELTAPDKAEAAADALLPLMPAAGHMVHMPSHIYQRVGRYADAMRSNELAIAADENYITQCRAQGLYPMAYYPHNIHFLWFAATADGQSRAALDAARKVAAKIDDNVLAEIPITAGFRVVPYWALARFGQWDAILKERKPPAANAFLTGSWHYVRGLAFTAKGQLAAADKELVALRATLKHPSLDGPMFSPNAGRAILAIAPHHLAGELAAARGAYGTAIAALERAVRLDDALVYTEPSEFMFPPRLALGAVLLQAGRPDEAETVYWEDLRRNRETGWALYGLHQALVAQKKTDDAVLIKARLDKAWARADVKLSASRFGRGPAAAAKAATSN